MLGPCLQLEAVELIPLDYHHVHDPDEGYPEDEHNDETGDDVADDGNRSSDQLDHMDEDAEYTKYDETIKHNFNLEEDKSIHCHVEKDLTKVDGEDIDNRAEHNDKVYTISITIMVNFILRFSGDLCWLDATPFLLPSA